MFVGVVFRRGSIALETYECLKILDPAVVWKTICSPCDGGAHTCVLSEVHHVTGG